MTFVFRRRELMKTALGVGGAYLLSSPTDLLGSVATTSASATAAPVPARCSCAAWGVAAAAGCPAAPSTRPTMSAAFAPSVLR